MKKVLGAIVLAVLVLSLSRMSAGQAATGSLDEQMFQAIEKGDFTAVLQLLDKGAHIDAQGKDGITALIAASAMSKTNVVKQLLMKGANTDIKDKRGDTALNYALMVSDVESVKLLLNKGASVNMQEEDGMTPLMLGIVSGKAEIVKLLLDKEIGRAHV